MEDTAPFHDDSTRSFTQPLLSGAEKAINVDFETGEAKAGHRLLPWTAHVASIVLFLSSIIVFLASGSSDFQCVERQASWCMKKSVAILGQSLLTRESAPALGAVLPFSAVQFNGSLDYPSPFRGKGLSVDAAWETIVNRKTSMKSIYMLCFKPDHEKITIVGALSLSDSDFQKLDLPLIPETTRLSERQGGGIYGTLEVFHQLHCVNYIRQYTYKEYYSPLGTFRDGPDLTRTHVDHCLEILRQKLTCDADVGVVTADWVTRRSTPWPNFNTWHKCRNFDRVVEWSKKNNAPYYGEKLRRPSDIAGLDPPP